MITRKQLEEMANLHADGIRRQLFQHESKQVYIAGFLAAVPIIFEAAREGQESLEYMTLKNGMIAEVSDGTDFKYPTVESILEALRS